MHTIQPSVLTIQVKKKCKFTKAFKFENPTNLHIATFFVDSQFFQVSDLAFSA